MRVFRGRAASLDEDREATRSLVDATATGGESAVRVWRPHRHVAFGRRDVRTDGYQRAREVARKQGFPPRERNVGGRAVAYTGATVAFARVEHLDDARTGIQTRYDRAADAIRRALGDVGIEARPGEPPNSFCPGSHSLQASGKIVGIAQHVRRDVAVVAGVVVTRDHQEIATVLEPIYRALDVSFETDSVGSVERAGGNADPETIERAIEEQLVGSCRSSVERIREA